MVNYYEVLQIDPKADGAVVRAAYRTLMKDLGRHPDHGGDSKEAQLLNEAYEHLMDPVKRSMVDKRLRFWKKADAYRDSAGFLARCMKCDTLNRVEYQMMERCDTVRCGNCAALLPVGKHAPRRHDPDPVVDRLAARLQDNDWKLSSLSDDYFDCVIENKFFLKNYLFVKRMHHMTPAHAKEVAEQCVKQSSSSISLTGRYFVILADRIDFISYSIETFKDAMERMKGLSSGVIIPVDLSRKQVFLSHVNLNHHPADIFNLRSYLFS
jgi:hypothetical protein